MPERQALVGITVTVIFILNTLMKCTFQQEGAKDAPKPFNFNTPNHLCLHSKATQRGEQGFLQQPTPPLFFFSFSMNLFPHAAIKNKNPTWEQGMAQGDGCTPGCVVPPCSLVPAWHVLLCQGSSQGGGRHAEEAGRLMQLPIT